MNMILLLAPVARMLKFYNIPLLTSGGLTFDFNEPKNNSESEFYMLTKTGISHTKFVNFTYDVFHR